MVRSVSGGITTLRFEVMVDCGTGSRSSRSLVNGVLPGSTSTSS
ncbi:hypothetical protein RKD48_007118 [Streptomyces ambofaciens]